MFISQFRYIHHSRGGNNQLISNDPTFKHSVAESALDYGDRWDDN